MPNQPPKAAAPSQGFLSRMFGGSPPMPPEMQQGLDIARQERPDLAPASTYGPISSMLQGGAGNQGYTGPGRGIYLNQNVPQRSPQDWADTAIHEQTHVDQMNQRGSSPTMEFLRQMFSRPQPYGQNPDEMGAFQAEKLRRARMGRAQTEVPSFTNPGQFYTPHDTNLSLPRPKAPIQMPVTMK